MAVTIFDCFPFHDELDLLEMRLHELEDIPNLKHVLVEATVTHQDAPKPLYFADNRERYTQWADRIIHVVADRLPTLAEDPDPWARELAQRMWMAEGLTIGAATSDDIVLQSDVDEIPRPVVVRNLRMPPRSGVISFEQRGHFWAVDWEYPPGWFGTTACRVDELPGFPQMRSMRNIAKSLPNAGWHFSWLGGSDSQVALRKVGSFCHPEVRERIENGIARNDFFWREGWHVDGIRMRPVDIDRTWPKWIVEGNAPTSWYRPR